MFIPPVITVFISIVVGIVLLTPTAFSQSIPKPLIDTELVEAEEPQEEEHPLEQARHAYNFHDDATTIQILGAFIDTTSDVDQLIEAYSLLSDAFTRRGEYQRAIDQLELRLSLLPPIDTIGIHTTLQGIADLYEQQGDFLAMVDTVLREHELARTEDREKLVKQINTMLQMQLTRDELRVLVDRYPTTFPGDAALAYLIQRYDQAGENEFFTMEQLVNRLVKQFPEHEYASFASARLSALRSQLLQHRHVIGVLLPLSGNLSSYAKDILNGIRLAVDQNQMAVSIGFVVIDIAQDDHTLIDHVNQLWHNFAPIALIGPLLSKNLGALTEWSEKFEVPVLSPTATKPDIAQRGSFLFSTAITEELLGNALARYAMLELGMTQFAILAPNDPYGSELSDAFSAAIAQMEGDVLATVSYEPGETDFGSYIQTIQTEDLKHDGTLLPPAEGDKEGRDAYFPGLDAIFLPDDLKTVGLIAAHLHYHDMNVTLLGANGWNTPDLLRDGEQAMEGGIFVDMFNLDSPEPAMQAFVRDYHFHYQTDPSEFSALAYDTTRLVIHAIQQGATNGRELGTSLRELRQFPSLSGPADMTLSGTLDRPLFVIKVEHGSFVQVK
ncbi:MAG TPA: hypothetical protein EYO39_11280 [Nitrospirales bacterium]|nr:hypothetical protein [Nitrospirales bacterium]